MSHRLREMVHRTLSNAMTPGASLCLVGTLIAGCATYRERPLGSGSTLPDHLSDVVVDRRAMPLPELAAHEFNPRDGLDITEVAMLAVVNNPDLKVARAGAGVAHAQAFAAGLLPDPTLGVSAVVPDGGQAATTTAYSFGLSLDVMALLTHSSRSSAAHEEARRTDLNLLWMEWQVVSQARQLFVRLTAQRQLMEVLQETRALYADRRNRTNAALGQGLLTLDATTPHLVAFQDVDRQINDLERLTNQSRHDLNALLGLGPDVAVQLAGPASLRALDDSAVQRLIPDLASRRPDLIALRAGYAAEEQRYRAAVLAQFPAIGLGFSRSRDATNVHQAGVGVTLTLPIFNRNRGAIAVEQATRDQLYIDYESRLNAAVTGIARILAEQRINQRQLTEIDQGLADLARAAASSAAAFQSRDVSALALGNIQASLLAKRVERITLATAILEGRVALQTLIGGELPERLSQ